MIRVAILTVSDSAVAGTRADASGPALKQHCESLGWTVADSAVVPDDVSDISRQLRDWANKSTANVIFTTGGTGISARDVTPEATRAVLDREIPGMAELIRAKGLEQTPFSVLSRGVVGSRGEALVVNLPGSPKGALHSLQSIQHLVSHVTDLLAGRTSHPSSALNTELETTDAVETSQLHDHPRAEGSL